MSEKEPERIFCAMPADSEFSIEGGTFDRFCSQCGRRVMLAPSGQRMLAKDPIPIVCMPCVTRMMNVADVLKAMLMAEPGGPEFRLAGDPKEIREELRKAIPNPWRKRN